MKNYFEESIPFIHHKDVKIKVECQDIWNTKTEFERVQWDMTFSLYDIYSVNTNLTLKPGSHTYYRNIKSGVFHIMDDYGNLHNTMYWTSDGDNWIDNYPQPPIPWMSSQSATQCILCKDDYGESIILDCTDEDDEDLNDGAFLGFLDTDGTICADNDPSAIGFVQYVPHIRKLPNLKEPDYDEKGWNILSQYATPDGMLCIRWLNLFGNVPNETHKPLFGHKNKDQWWKCRSTSRKMLEYETTTTREVAAEVFPMERGSLLARWRNLKEHNITIGLVIDPHQSDLREIFPHDCYSAWSDTEQKLIPLRDYLPSWSGWENARKAYFNLPQDQRKRRTYTEAFIQCSTPIALVVYGNQRYMNDLETGLIRKFTKNGFPVYHLENNH